MRITSSSAPPPRPAAAPTATPLSPPVTSMPAGITPLRPASTTRHAAIDILRGLCLVVMIFVLFPHPEAVGFSWLQLERWQGCYIPELLFALFLFLSGASMACALTQRERQPALQRFRYILSRACFLFALGIALNLLSELYPSPGHVMPRFDSIGPLLELRPIYGILQRLALCLLLSAVLILLLRHKILILLSVVGLLALRSWILTQPADLPTSITLVHTLEVQANSSLDLHFLKEARLDPRHGSPFASYGLLSILTGSTTLLLGYLSGSLLRQGLHIDKQLRLLGAIGVLCVLFALLLNRELPIIGALSTSNYVLITVALSIGLLCLFSHVSRFSSVLNLLSPLRIIGSNPLIAYLLALLLSHLVGLPIMRLDGAPAWTLQNWFFECVNSWLHFIPRGQELVASVVYSLSFTLIVLLPCWILAKMRIHFTIGFKA